MRYVSAIELYTNLHNLRIITRTLKLEI